MKKKMRRTPKTNVAFGADRTDISVPNSGEALVVAGAFLFTIGLVVLAIENQ
jgi:hypothetical protein